MNPHIFTALSKQLNVEEAALRAVVEVESNGNGFLPNGKPKILFEPHVFWEQLEERGLKPEDHVQGNEDILRPKWVRGQYGKYSEQWLKLERAKAIHEEAALCSASYGAFQVLGDNWKMCGFDSVQDMVEAMHSEEGQLKAFIGFVKKCKLIDEMQNHDWRGFARVYNGPGYAKNEYHTKLAKAYAKYKGA